MESLRSILEALIFTAESPLTIEKMCHIMPDVDRKTLAETVAALCEEYEKRGGGLRLCHVAGGYQFRTTDDMAPWVKKMKGTRPVALSMAALETLAVIAYRQPIMKSEIERIRGVDVGGVLKTLLEKNLVRIVGRKDVPGRPIIYGTNRKFLEFFNLRDLSDLPTLKELEG